MSKILNGIATGACNLSTYANNNRAKTALYLVASAATVAALGALAGAWCSTGGYCLLGSCPATGAVSAGAVSAGSAAAATTTSTTVAATTTAVVAASAAPQAASTALALENVTLVSALTAGQLLSGAGIVNASNVVSADMCSLDGVLDPSPTSPVEEEPVLTTSVDREGGEHVDDAPCAPPPPPTHEQGPVFDPNMDTPRGAEAVIWNRFFDWIGETFQQAPHAMTAGVATVVAGVSGFAGYRITKKS